MRILNIFIVIGLIVTPPNIICIQISFLLHLSQSAGQKRKQNGSRKEHSDACEWLMKFTYSVIGLLTGDCPS